MEKQVFELFMRLRFPEAKSDKIYYDTWKVRFEGNPLDYMDLESIKVFKDVLQILYLNSILLFLRRE